MLETWKDIEGYEGLYMVSSFSAVYSLTHKRVIQPTKKADLYLHMKLYKNGVSRMHYAHRLSAKSFVPNPKNKPFVNHKDGNKLNNYVGNFEWATASENTIHSFRLGLQISLKDGDHPCAKRVVNVKTGVIYNSIKEACATTEVRYGTFLAQVTNRNFNQTNFVLYATKLRVAG